MQENSFSQRRRGHLSWRFGTIIPAKVKARIERKVQMTLHPKKEDPYLQKRFTFTLRSRYFFLRPLPSLAKLQMVKQKDHILQIEGRVKNEGAEGIRNFEQNVILNFKQGSLIYSNVLGRLF